MALSANGVQTDLMKDDSEYIACTLGLTLEDNVVNYIVPAASAHLEGSVQVGDRIVAGMGLGHKLLDLVLSFGCPACHAVNSPGGRSDEAFPHWQLMGVPWMPTRWWMLSCGMSVLATSVA